MDVKLTYFDIRLIIFVLLKILYYEELIRFRSDKHILITDVAQKKFNKKW